MFLRIVFADNRTLFNKSSDSMSYALLRKSALIYIWHINPLQPGVAYLYPLKTSENVKVF